MDEEGYRFAQIKATPILRITELVLGAKIGVSLFHSVATLHSRHIHMSESVRCNPCAVKHFVFPFG
jgi:hypothetical protein